MFDITKKITFYMGIILLLATAFTYIQYELGNATVVDTDDENF